MRIYLIVLILIHLSVYLSLAQDVKDVGFEQNKNQSPHEIPDAKMIQTYMDSLSRIYPNELLTAYVYSTLHEIVPNAHVEYSINNLISDSLVTDNKGRFFITNTKEIKELRIIIDEKDYYFLDTVFYFTAKSPKSIAVELIAKYKILLRGRIFAGSMPIEGAQVLINHNTEMYKLATLGCYTDDENYWNCLYLGLFKQNIVFEDPNDSLRITIAKEGFLDQTINMTMKDYDGTILPFKMQYDKALVKFPKHNLGLKFGLTFQNTWSVALNYIHQMRIGNFNRLGIGLDATMLVSTITSTYPTFDYLSYAKAEKVYTTGAIGPVVNFSITDPTNRLFNVYAGIVVPYLFSAERLSLHPYLAGKFYLDINKAVFWELKYIDYTISESDYEFNPYGNATEVPTQTKQDYQKLQFSLGLLVSF